MELRNECEKVPDFQLSTFQEFGARTYRCILNKHPTVADIVGAVVLVGLVAWIFWVLLGSVPYREIPIWML